MADPDIQTLRLFLSIFELRNLTRAASLTKVVSGPLGDRFARRPLIATGYGMAALGKLASRRWYSSIVSVASSPPGESASSNSRGAFGAPLTA